jgi:predicted acylesterase/phospholipase RssA
MKSDSHTRKGKRWFLSIFSIIPLSIFLFAFLFVFPSDKKDRMSEPIEKKERNGTAVIITGAAARIPQEAALLEELDRRGLLKELVFISGVSSGALNAIILNGILSKKITWEEYHKLLDSLDNRHIFIQEGKKIPVSTAPARELYKMIFEDELGYHSIGDLPITTSISFTHLEDLKLRRTEYRMCSRKINAESDTTLSLVDVAMASSAFPVVFPPVRIRNAKTIPDVEFVDGGLGDDHVPWRALLQFEKFRGIGVERVYIISRESDDVPAISEELKGFGINDKGIFDKLGISFDAILSRGIIRGIESYATEAPELVPLSYVWMPVLDTNFLFFNFDALGEQYTRTSAWADTNDPVRLADFLLPYLLKGK